MFYEQIVLAKQGPLGNVWLAAHWEKKLSKQQINETNIAKTVERLTNPRAPMALRLSGHLLLGVVRIYYRQVEYLYQDCSEALVKIKMAFRPTNIDLDESVANLNAITMPETFGDFEIILPGELRTDLLPEAEEGLITINLNTARVSDITIAAEVDDIRLAYTQPPVDDMLSQQDISSVASAFDPFHPDITAVIGDEPLAAPIDILAPEIVAPPEEGAATQIEIQPPPVPPEPQLPENLFEPLESSSVSVSEKELPIGTDMPALAPAAQRLRNKRYKVDKRTELSKKVMVKTIEDPTPLLRRLERAPPTRELMRERQLELEYRGAASLFQKPCDQSIPNKLQKLIQRTMRAKENIDLPKGLAEDTSMEEKRGAELPPPEVPPPPPPPELPPIEDLLPIDVGPFDTIAGMAADSTTGPEVTVPEITAPEVTGGPSITGGEDEEMERQQLQEGQQQGLIITKRTAAMHHFLAKKFDEEGKEELSFEELFAQKKKRTVAIAFFEILNIRSKNCIQLKQEDHWKDLIIMKTPYFERLTT